MHPMPQEPQFPLQDEAFLLPCFKMKRTMSTIPTRSSIPITVVNPFAKAVPPRD